MGELRQPTPSEQDGQHLRNPRRQPSDWTQTHGTRFDVPEEVRKLRGFDDRSWKNDACPCFGRDLPDGAELLVWVDAPDPATRECAMAPRFSVMVKRGDQTEALYSGESVETAVAAALVRTPGQRVYLVWEADRYPHARVQRYEVGTVQDDGSVLLDETHVGLEEWGNRLVWREDDVPVEQVAPFTVAMEEAECQLWFKAYGAAVGAASELTTTVGLLVSQPEDVVLEETRGVARSVTRKLRTEYEAARARHQIR